MNLKLFILLISISNYASAQNIELKIGVLNSDPIFITMPLVISAKISNPTNDTLLFPNLFYFSTTTLKYWRKGSKDTLTYIKEGGNNDFSNSYFTVLPKENFNCFESEHSKHQFYFINWAKRMFLLKDKNMTYQAELEQDYYIHGKKYSLKSNIVEFKVNKMNQEDKKILKYLNSTGKPLDYIYAIGKKEDFDKILNNCDLLIQKYHSPHFTPYFLRTISTVYEMCKMENDFIEDDKDKNKNVLERAEAHFKKLLDTPNLPDSQKKEIQKYHQEYKKRLDYQEKNKSN